MAEELRALNEEGRRQYREWLEKLRDNPALEVPVALLDDPACAFAPLPGLQLPAGPFATKLALAERLLPAIEQVEKTRLPEDRWPGVWDGLALAYFDEICPLGAGGNRRVGEIERYIWDSRHIRFYKNRIAAPVTLFRAHREHSIVFLCGAPSVLRITRFRFVHDKTG
jgi:hypothetical protein